jgi:hypothetical protein
MAPAVAAIGFLASFALLLGIGSRIASIVAWLAVCTFHHRAPLLMDPHDILLAAALAYLMIDTGNVRWSIRPALVSGGPRLTCNLVIRLFQCHFWIWIAFSLASMLSFPVWWNGQAASVLVQDHHGWLSLPTDWHVIGQALTHFVVVLHVAILICMLQPACDWLGRWMLYALLTCMLLLIGDWMYAATLFGFSLTVWPIQFIKAQGTS